MQCSRETVREVPVSMGYSHYKIKLSVVSAWYAELGASELDIFAKFTSKSHDLRITCKGGNNMRFITARVSTG
jgi:hypothetical protein